MGARQAVHVETPEFRSGEWEYVAQEEGASQEYGMFRTLRNLKTGERIDEYEFMWPNEEEFDYYLKSFNWRHRQANVVGTRFMVQRSGQDFCSHGHMASIYIQHMKLRLSEIGDIPYPDNLYVLMEALEGYGKIYEHSKYFEIMENQICVDDAGNLKIWVNADLSVNYPNQEESAEARGRGQEEMVDALVRIVAYNTDAETEPSPSFAEYFAQKRGQKGKKFEEARVLVMNYARSNNTEIPARFEAVMVLDNDSKNDLKSYTDHSRIANENERSKANQRLYEQENERDKRQGATSGTYFSTSPASAHQIANQQLLGYHPSHVYAHPGFVGQPIYYPHPMAYYPPQVQYCFGQPQHMQTIPHIPHYARMQQPLRPINNVMPQQQQPAPVQQNNYVINAPSYQAQPYPQSSQIHNRSEHNSEKLEPPKYEITKLIDLQEDPDMIRVTLYTKDHKHEQDEPSIVEYTHRQDQFGAYPNQYVNYEQNNYEQHERYSNQSEKQYDKNQREQSSMSISEADDMVARSLPIRAGYPSQGNQQLASMGQNDRAIYSHISPKDQWSGNADGFGLAKNSQMQESESSNKGKNNLSSIKTRPEARSIRYFTLDEELEMDPDIAADLARLVL